MTRFNREDSRTVLPQLEKKMDELSDKVSELFIVDMYTPQNYDFTANQYRSISFSYTARKDYTQLVTSAWCTSHSAIRVFNVYISGGNIVVETLNTSSSSVYGANFRITVLNLKTELSE